MKSFFSIFMFHIVVMTSTDKCHEKVNEFKVEKLKTIILKLQNNKVILKCDAMKKSSIIPNVDAAIPFMYKIGDQIFEEKNISLKNQIKIFLPEVVYQRNNTFSTSISMMESDNEGIDIKRQRG